MKKCYLLTGLVGPLKRGWLVEKWYSTEERDAPAIHFRVGLAGVCPQLKHIHAEATLGKDEGHTCPCWATTHNRYFSFRIRRLGHGV